MRITRVDLAGVSLPDSAMPRAVATLRRPSDRGYINVDVFRANGRTDQFAFPPDYHPKSSATRYRQACRLADHLDGTEDGAKAILQVVETMIEMAGPAPEPTAVQDDKEMMEETMQNVLSPEAVAAVAWGVRRTITNDKRVQRQLDWLATILESMVGGPIEHQKTCDELGMER